MIKRVLILCTGNSCRSQMAEGFINHELGDAWRADSAGTRPSGCVHPLAIRAMSELGVDISGNSSKSVEEFRNVAFSQVITVCDSAAEDCPVWLGEGEVTHIPFDDPAAATGSEAAQLAVFRRVRDEIRERIVEHLRQQF